MAKQLGDILSSSPEQSGISKVSQTTLRDIVTRTVTRDPAREEEGVPLAKVDVIEGHNHRKTFDPLYIDDLADSIIKNGMRSAVWLIEQEDGRYGLIAGECRYRALRQVGITHFDKADIYPAIAAPYLRTLALMENLQRKDVSGLETVDGIVDALQNEYEGVSNAKDVLVEMSGLPKEKMGQALVIAEQLKKEPRIRDICEKKDAGFRTLYDLAMVAKLSGEAHGAKSKHVDETLKLLHEDRLSYGKLQDVITSLKKYLKGKAAKPVLVVKGKEQSTKTPKESLVEKKPESPKKSNPTTHIDRQIKELKKFGEVAEVGHIVEKLEVIKEEIQSIIVNEVPNG